MAQPYQLGQNLFQTSTEELQNLAAQKGLTQAPTTPLGANGIGATSKQADMTGSKAQKQALLNPQQQQKQNLQQAQTVQQPSSGLTQQEQAAQQKAQQLSNLGSLGSRVQSIISGQLWQQASANQGASGLEVADNPDLTGYTPSSSYDPTQFKSLLDQYSYSQDPNDLAQINNMLGRTQTTTLSAADIQAFYKPVNTQVGSQLAKATPDTITVGQVDPTQLGFTDANQMAQLLNLDPNTIANMSLSDLQTAVKSEQQKEFTNVQSLKAKINDPNVGDAERQQAQAQLAQMSQSGVTGTEAQVGQVANQVQNADTVTLAGKSYQVKDLLSDQGISDIVSAYLNDDPADADWRKQLEAQSPDLVNWINKNQAQLTGVMTKVGQGVKDFQDIQQANKDVATVTSGGRFNDDVMTALVPTWGQISGTKIDPNSIPLLQMANDTNNPNAANITSQINQLAKDNPEVLKELGGLTTDQLKNLGLNNPNSDVLKNYSQYKQDIKDLKNIPDNDVNTLLNKVFGETVDPKQIQTNLNNAINQETLLGGSTGALNTLESFVDPGKDGVLEDPASIKQAMLNYLGNQNVSLTDVANGTQVKTVSGAVNPDQAFATVQQAVHNFEQQTGTTAMMQGFNPSNGVLYAPGGNQGAFQAAGNAAMGKNGANMNNLYSLYQKFTTTALSMDPATKISFEKVLGKGASDMLDSKIDASYADLADPNWLTSQGNQMDQLKKLNSYKAAIQQFDGSGNPFIQKEHDVWQNQINKSIALSYQVNKGRR